jgi:hypothetical protein
VTFCSFLREPRPDERYMASWTLPAGGQGGCPVRGRLARLSRRLYMPYAWPQSADGGREAWENPSIPAGYTYLAQFLAHDAVHSTVPTAALRRSGQTVRNGRSAPLELQTLYGSGFDGCLTAVTDHDRERLTPSKLPLGQIRVGETIDATCPFRDIPRALSPHTTGNAVGLRNVLIADDRNDNNVLVSQVAMLFALFHNAVVDVLHGGRRATGAQDLAYLAELFDDARSVCIDTYRRIVRNDLLQRLLHPAVHAACSSGQYLDARSQPPITFELLQALRFGHAMVRPHYRVNDVLGRREELIDVLLTTSRSRPWRLPLDESWPVRWSRFYAIAGSSPNLSRRIGPCFSPDLVSELAFDRIDETGAVGLAYRDLVSGAGLPMWSANALIAEIARRSPDLVQASRLLSDVRHREAVLAAWLSERTAATGLTDADIADLSRDPPLLLLVLIEAAHDAQGERLGILGSIVIGEPIFKIMDSHRPSRGEGQLAATTRLSSMADLVGFVREHADLDESAIPFV